MALKDYAPNPAVLPVDGIGRHFIVNTRIDFSAVPLGASDTAKLLEIKAGWDVKKVWTKIVTPEAAADTFGLGDSGGADWMGRRRSRERGSRNRGQFGRRDRCQRHPGREILRLGRLPPPDPERRARAARPRRRHRGRDSVLTPARSPEAKGSA